MDERLELRYPIDAPDGTIVKPKRQWWWGEERFKKTKEWGGIEFLKGKNGWSVQYKQYLKVSDGENRSEKPFSVINPPSVFVGPYTQEGTAELREIFEGDSPVPFPKPTRLVSELLSITKAGGSGKILVLDSFAGSGTTAHAVLKANAEDTGDRKFILIETEDYADALTAERVRRVIKGVPGAKDEALRNGLGGSFTYCELGEPIDLDRFFQGRNVPPYAQVARYIIYTATGLSIAEAPEAPDDLWFVGEAGGYRIHLIYKPDLKWMKSDGAALTEDLAQRIAKAAGGKPAPVYGAQKFIGQKALTQVGVTFCQMPYAIYRILGNDDDAA